MKSLWGSNMKIVIERGGRGGGPTFDEGERKFGSGKLLQEFF